MAVDGDPKGATVARLAMLFFGDPPEGVEAAARALLDTAEGVRAGVTLVNGIVVARLLGEATAVRAATIAFLTGLRGQRLPRVWHV